MEVLQSLPRDLLAREDQLVATFRKLEGTALAKLERLYVFMEEVYKFVNRFTPCKKGCSYCCFYRVSISELEIQLMEAHGIKSSMTGFSGEPHGTQCPFLDRNKCSIYKYRPFVCRQHIMLDHSAKWCRPDVCNDIPLANILFTEINKVYRALMHESGLQRRVDIREVFARQGNVSLT